MYGLLLESIQYYITTDFGDDTWAKILEHAGKINYTLKLNEP